MSTSFLMIILAANNPLTSPGLYFMIAIFAFVMYMRAKKNVRVKWQEFLFPDDTQSYSDRLMEIYICLGARMIRADRKESAAKLQYMHRHFRKHFPNSYMRFSEALSHAYDNPVNLRTVGNWIKINLDYKDRLQVMYFMTGLSYVDGFMDGKEKEIIVEMRDILDITPKDFQSLMGMYKQREERYHQKRKREEKTRKEPSQYRRKSAIRLSCEILGVSEYASMDEIKKAYRRLVKLHHPDRFATDSAEQQKVAEERFIEVQKAYEIMEKYK